MNKVLVLLAILIGSSTGLLADGDKYKIDDQAIEEMFANAIEVNFIHESDNFFTLTGSNLQEMISVDKDKTTAGLLGIFLGSFGIHRAYSDSPFKVWGVYAGVTVGSIVCGTAGSFVGCPFGFLFTGIPGIIGLVDGIIILSGEDSEYRSKWIGSNKLLNW